MSEFETKIIEQPSQTGYAARLNIDYPETLDRMSTLLRLFYLIPIAIIWGLLAGAGSTTTTTTVNEMGQVLERSSNTTGGLAAGLTAATALMIILQQRYPRWWFDFWRELTRFSTRIGAYAALLTDKYPSTEDEQSVHLEIDYPDVKNNLNRWMPLVKWFLAIPHWIVLAFLGIGAFFAIIFAWFSILISGEYPRAIFDYVVGVTRWGLRVEAYALMLVTDEYPPFSLQ